MFNVKLVHRCRGKVKSGVIKRMEQKLGSGAETPSLGVAK